MQEHDWDDIRVVLALHRLGSLSGAGRKLGTSETTVARRLRRLEHALGTALFLRNETGRFEPTDAGRAMLQHAEAVERENDALRERLGLMADRLTGVVRISAVPVIVNQILVPNLAVLIGRHPDLLVELVPEGRNIDLTRREADLAVRFARPGEGGLAVSARKLGELEFGVFCAADIAPDAVNDMPWIGYDDANAALPQARWTAAQRKKTGGDAASFGVADIETALAAAIWGYGKAILPKMICLEDDRLRAVPPEARGQHMVREVWLLSHAERDVRLSVAAAKEWLIGLDWR